MSAKHKETGVYTSAERLYLDKDGRVVGESDPGRVTLLVSAGGRLPMDRARAVGLADADGRPILRTAAAPKAVAPPAAPGEPTDEEKRREEQRTKERQAAQAQGKAMGGPPENKGVVGPPVAVPPSSVPQNPTAAPPRK